MALSAAQVQNLYQQTLGRSSSGDSLKNSMNVGSVAELTSMLQKSPEYYKYQNSLSKPAPTPAPTNTYTPPTYAAPQPAQNPTGNYPHPNQGVIDAGFAAAAAKYSGGDVAKFKADNPSMYANMYKNMANGDVSYSGGSGGLGETWNSASPNAPGTWNGEGERPAYQVGWQDNLKRPPPPQQSGFGAGQTMPRPSSDVMGRISDVTATDSPLMAQARARGFQAANSRGLINSSLAGQAAEQAVLDVAVPIGSQQDSQNFQANENFRGFGYNADLQEKQFDQNSSLQEQQYYQNAGLQSEKFYQNTALQEQQNNQAAKSLTLQERSAVSTGMNAADVAYQNALNNIMANTNLTAEVREQQTVAARDRFDTSRRLVEQVYNIDLSW
jgi:hypothetical protein